MQNQELLYLTLRIFYKPVFYKSLRLFGYFSDNVFYSSTLCQNLKKNKNPFHSPLSKPPSDFVSFLRKCFSLILFFTWTALILPTHPLLTAFYQFSVSQSIFFETKIKACHPLCFWPFNRFSLLLRWKHKILYFLIRNFMNFFWMQLLHGISN